MSYRVSAKKKGKEKEKTNDPDFFTLSDLQTKNPYLL